MTSQEKMILEEIDSNIFKVITPINIPVLVQLTKKHPNCPYINYIINGLKEGFRYSFRSQ